MERACEEDLWHIFEVHGQPEDMIVNASVSDDEALDAFAQLHDAWGRGLQKKQALRTSDSDSD